MDALRPAGSVAVILGLVVLLAGSATFVPTLRMLTAIGRVVARAASRSVAMQEIRQRSFLSAMSLAVQSVSPPSPISPPPASMRMAPEP